MSGPFDTMMPYLKQIQEQFGSMFSGTNANSKDTSGGFFGSGGQNPFNGWPLGGGSFNPTEFLRNFGMQQGGVESYAVDIYETKNHLVVVAEIPGIASASDVTLEIHPDVLVIRGRVERHYPGSRQQQVLHVAERKVGSFERRVSLPVSVETSGAQARYQNGLLEVRLVRKAGRDVPRGAEVPIEFR